MEVILPKIQKYVIKGDPNGSLINIINLEKLGLGGSGTSGEGK
jgi:hypothetical protein